MALAAATFVVTYNLAWEALLGEMDVWRTETCVHFLLEGQEVGPKHELDRGEALREKKSDVYWKKGERYGYRRYDGPDLERYARIYAITPEGLRVEGMIYFVVENNYYLVDFQLPIRPGWSGTPVFEHETGLCIGLISGVRYGYNFLGYPIEYGIIGRIPPTFPEQPVEEAEEDPEDDAKIPDGAGQDQGGGK
jgi:hypothetical protein